MDIDIEPMVRCDDPRPHNVTMTGRAHTCALATHAMASTASAKSAANGASGRREEPLRNDIIPGECGGAYAPACPVNVRMAIQTPSATHTTDMPIATTLPSHEFTRSPRIFLSFAITSKNASTIGNTNALNAST